MEGRSGRNEPIVSRLGPLATVVLACSTLGALGVLGFALTRFHPELSVTQLTIFYLAPALWALASVFALRSRPDIRIGFLLIQAALGVALLLGELTSSAWLALRARKVERPSVREDLARLRAAGVTAYPKVPGDQLVELDPRFDTPAGVLHPISPGPGHAVLLLCDEDRPRLTYHGDRYGFDNPDSVWSLPTVDLALIGDSYTVGVCVESAQAIPGRLRERGTVLNLGISGAGPLQELAVLREYAASHRPKTVAWILYEGNDLWDLASESTREWLLAYLDSSHTQRLVEEHEWLDAAYRGWIDSLYADAPQVTARPPLWDHREVLRLSTLRALAPVAAPVPRRGSRIGLLPEILDRARRDVQAWGGRFVVIYMPSYARYATRFGDPVPARTEVLRMLRDLRIELIDLHPVMQATSDPRALWVTPRTHLSAEGYGVAADAIARALDAPRRD